MTLITALPNTCLSLEQSFTDLVETTIDEELSTVWFQDAKGYNFVMHDGSGDCGFVIVVGFDGSINKDFTYEKWSCY